MAIKEVRAVDCSNATTWIMQKSRLILVLILASACNQLRGVAGVPLESFYPFGSAASDTSLGPNDDGSSPSITLSTAPFPFFDQEHSTVFVNNNGVLSFTTAVSQFTPNPFPLTGNLQLIAPYWADVDTRGTGTVWYRETTDPQLLQRAGDEIQAAFISQGSFAPSYIFIATWERVGYFNQHTDRTNTFQCVMATDGINSFVIYLYASGLIQWTTGDASGGSGGLGGTPAQVGFNAGDGIRFANVPGSRTDEIINITQTSNVGVTGVWIFRVDSEEIVVAGCSFEPDAILTIAPRLGSVLGGTVVSFSGPCLEETDNITCVFDGVEVEGVFMSMRLGVCISPPLSAVGRLSFQLRVVNASQFTRFEGDAAFFSIPTFEDGLTVRNGFSVDIVPPLDLNFQTGEFFFLRWSPQMIVPIANPTSYTVNITLYGLTDPDTEIWTEIMTVANNLPNTGEAFFFLPDLSMSGIPEVCPTSIQVGLGGTTALTRPQNDTVIERLMELGLAVRSGVWSAAGYAIELADRELRLTCQEWCESQPVGIGEQLNGQVMPCPPTLEQANRDNRFDRENPLVSGTFHTGTAGCFRQVITGNQCRPGSQCCYGNNGNLIVGSPNGGTVDRVSPQGSLRCYLDHFLQDVVPVVYCCAGLFNECERYYEKRPSTSSTGYRFPVPATGFGDPHMVTLDGLGYTFNGNGEFVLIETADRSFTLQGRMVGTDAIEDDVQAAGGGEPVAPATVFSALVARQNDSDTVQFEVSRRGLDALVNGERIELGESEVSEQEFNNVVVSALGNNSLSARFANGAYIEVTEELGIISVLSVVLPSSLEGVTRGLMGNFNGDTSDDLIPRGSNMSLSTDASIEEIHNEFGITWIIGNAEDSLFTYGLGESFASFFDPGFTPRFEPTFSSPVLEMQANEICGDDSFCLFDIAATGRTDIGLATINSSQTFDENMNLSIPIVCDPPCVNGACVANDTCSCSAGFEGELCTEPVIMECDTNPCENGGNCTLRAGSFICTCREEFEGTLCQTPIRRECDSNPCLNGGTCTAILGLTPLCDCPPGFSGPLCETEVLVECDTNPCQNGGTCTGRMGNTFFCSCSVGFTGSLCEQALCLPQLVSTLPISAQLVGARLCPAPQTPDSDFIDFVISEILSRPISEGCSVENVELVFCQSRGLRTEVLFTANLVCGSSCRRHLDIRSSFNAIDEVDREWRTARRSTPSFVTTYEGNDVTVILFMGRITSFERVCPLGVIGSIRNRLDLCACPQGCPEVCELPPETGPCRAFLPRYFFNSTSDQCEQFIYGGCDGNDNNFETEEACQNFCTECPNGREFQSCGTACPRTCENVDDPPIPCTLQCVAGCFCPEGLVELGDQCVLPEECPSIEY